MPGSPEPLLASGLGSAVARHSQCSCRLAAFSWLVGVGGPRAIAVLVVVTCVRIPSQSPCPLACPMQAHTNTNFWWNAKDSSLSSRFSVQILYCIWLHTSNHHEAPSPCLCSPNSSVALSIGTCHLQHNTPIVDPVLSVAQRPLLSYTCIPYSVNPFHSFLALNREPLPALICWHWCAESYHLLTRSWIRHLPSCLLLQH